MQMEHVHIRREIEAGERSNLIIAVGDLALRFPNLLEPWTAHIYQPLSDPDTGAPCAFSIKRSYLLVPICLQRGLSQGVTTTEPMLPSMKKKNPTPGLPGALPPA